MDSTRRERTTLHRPGRGRSGGLRLAITLSVLFVVGLGLGVIFALQRSTAEATPTALGDEPGLELARGSSAIPVLDVDNSHPAPQTQGSASSSRLTPIVIAARRVSPAVVSIRTTRTVTAPRTVFDEFFRRGGRSQTVPGLGSGFAIDADGTILTNQHVISDADSVIVIDENGQRFRAELIGSDAFTDLAVVKIDSGLIPASPLGTSSDLMIGEPAIAIGNPSGFQLVNSEATITTGVISGVGRDIRGSGEEVLYADMIQTDAAINPGNSGGPLVNADGQVIGVNSSIFSRSGGSEGLGFAIPIDRARRIAAELVEFGRVRRPWVGFDVVRRTSDNAFGVPVVDRVVEDSPGEAADLRDGDVIVSIDGKPVHHELDWEIGLEEAGVNNTVEIQYRRGGRLLAASLSVEEVPSERAQPLEVLSGLRLATVTPQIAQERGFSVEFGAWIVEIDARTAGITRLRQNDVIFGINANEVQTAEDAAGLFRYYGQQREGTRVRVNVARGAQRGVVPFYIGGQR
jgi:serine protease Do